MILALVDGDARRCGGAARSRRRATARRSSPPTRTRSRRSRRRRALPAGGHRAARARRRPAARRVRERPTGTRSAPARLPARAFRSIAQLTAALLGFDGPTGNTYGSIATVDYLLESVSAAAVLLAGLGRFVQDLLLWCTARVRLPAARRRVRAVQQHHAAEAQPGCARARARDRAARRSARRGAIVLAVHNTPFGDIVDTEDDLQPLVFVDVPRCARGPCGWWPRRWRRRVRSPTRMAERAARGLDHRDRAGRHAGARSRRAVRAGHAIAAQRLVPRRRPARSVGTAGGLREVSLGSAGNERRPESEALARVLSPRHFVEVRKTPGGPAPSETARAIAASRLRLAEDDGWLEIAIERLCADERAESKQAVARLKS